MIEQYDRKKYPTYYHLKKYLIENGIDSCHWCGVKVILYRSKEHENAPNNMATIDHIKSRYFRERGEVVRKVLACYLCNQKRANAEDRKYQKDYLRKINKYN